MTVPDVIDAPPLVFDHLGRASLDGTWAFFPEGGDLDELDRRTPEQIRVPALWEAEGYVDLDGAAWYRRRFTLRTPPDHASLTFGAVMDIADVYLNGTHLGTNDSPFTPFTFDVGPTLVAGPNVLTVRVYDPSIGDREHRRIAHGKQGWANTVFPSRPSLYMTYGGIWQPVTLRRHGAIVLDDVWINGDPDDVRVVMEVRNTGGAAVGGRLSLRTLGLIREFGLDLEPGQTERIVTELGRTDAARWTPERPVLHEATADVEVADALSDGRTQRFGLRTIAVDGTRLVLNGAPYRMKSVLVQGFRADGLYSEGDDGSIRDELAAARAMGFNTVRLHIKAFDPRYLDLCDEMGMLAHCDIPVAEPIAHEEMGGGGLLDERCISAVTAQIRRDRNHPCIVLWSAMNEICDERREARTWEGYERFARALADAVARTDPFRPFIENDWVEPDPGRVFVSPILTAHWYGRLHADYLRKLEDACDRWRDVERPLLVTEFGDWGLPAMPAMADPPFWDTRDVYTADLAATRWPDSVDRFVVETQRYQGVSDRLQLEVFRRHDHVAGYCLTELTDVPFELNGVLDLRRAPKDLAVREIARGNQTVLPMVALDTFVVEAGSAMRAPVCVANDGPALEDVTLEVRFDDAAEPMPVEHLLQSDTSGLPVDLIAARFHDEGWATRIADLEPYGTTRAGTAMISAPDVPGNHELVLRLRAGGSLVAENRYPVHVVLRRTASATARLLGDDPMGARALESVGVTIGRDGPLIVGEGRLDGTAAEELRACLSDGGTALVLAQPPEAACHYPGEAELGATTTAWGSSVFHFTTDDGALPSFPRRRVLVVEDSTINARSAVVSIGGSAFPDHPMVIMYKPGPGAMTGTIVGEHPIGPGRLVFCQYRLVEAAIHGDAAGTSILADLVRWCRAPRRPPQRETTARADGRHLHRYSFPEPS
jgi:hypothetical protein